MPATAMEGRKACLFVKKQKNVFNLPRAQEYLRDGPCASA